MSNFPGNLTQEGKPKNERSVAARRNNQNQNRSQPNQFNTQGRTPAVPAGYHVVKFPPQQRNDANNYNVGAPAAGDAFGPFGTNATVDTDALAVGNMLAYRNPYVGIAPVLPLTSGVIASPQPEVFGLEPIEGVPPGFEALHGHGIFYIREHVDAFEFFTGYEMSNRYSIYSPPFTVLLNVFTLPEKSLHFGKDTATLKLELLC